MTVEQWFIYVVEIYYSNSEKVSSLLDECHYLLAAGVKWVAVDNCVACVIHHTAMTRRDLKSQIDDYA